jgi:hypothetical protein
MGLRVGLVVLVAFLTLPALSLEEELTEKAQHPIGKRFTYGLLRGMTTGVLSSAAALASDDPFSAAVSAAGIGMATNMILEGVDKWVGHFHLTSAPKLARFFDFNPQFDGVMVLMSGVEGRGFILDEIMKDITKHYPYDKRKYVLGGNLFHPHHDGYLREQTTMAHLVKTLSDDSWDFVFGPNDLATLRLKALLSPAITRFISDWTDEPTRNQLCTAARLLSFRPHIPNEHPLSFILGRLTPDLNAWPDTIAASFGCFPKRLCRYTKTQFEASNADWRALREYERQSLWQALRSYFIENADFRKLMAKGQVLLHESDFLVAGSGLGDAGIQCTHRKPKVTLDGPVPYTYDCAHSEFGFTAGPDPYQTVYGGIGTAIDALNNEMSNAVEAAVGPRQEDRRRDEGPPQEVLPAGTCAALPAAITNDNYGSYLDFIEELKQGPHLKCSKQAVGEICVQRRRRGCPRDYASDDFDDFVRLICQLWSTHSQPMGFPGEKAMNAALRNPVLPVDNEVAAYVAPRTVPLLLNHIPVDTEPIPRPPTHPSVTNSRGVLYYLLLWSKSTDPVCSMDTMKHIGDLAAMGIRFVSVGNERLAGPLILRFSPRQEGCRFGEKDVVAVSVDMSGYQYNQNAGTAKWSYIVRRPEGMTMLRFAEFDGATHQVSLDDTFNGKQRDIGDRACHSVDDVRGIAVRGNQVAHAFCIQYRSVETTSELEKTTQTIFHAAPKQDMFVVNERGVGTWHVTQTQNADVRRMFTHGDPPEYFRLKTQVVETGLTTTTTTESKLLITMTVLVLKDSTIVSRLKKTEIPRPAERR